MITRRMCHHSQVCRIDTLGEDGLYRIGSSSDFERFRLLEIDQLSAMMLYEAPANFILGEMPRLTTGFLQILALHEDIHVAQAIDR